MTNLLNVLKKFLATFGEMAEKLMNFIDENGVIYSITRYRLFSHFAVNNF